MRVALISHSAGGGGAERALARLAPSLDREAWQPLVVVPEAGPLADELRDLGIAVSLLPTGWWIPATHWTPEQFLAQLGGLEERTARLAALLAAERIELVHSNTVVTLEGALAAAQLGLPHVWHSRGLFDDRFPPPYFGDLAFLFSAFDQLSDALVCVSGAVADQARSHCREAPVEVVPDALDLDDLARRAAAASRGALLEQLALPDDARIVACLGGLQRRKGQLDVVLAAARVAPRFPEVVFVLAGAASDPEYAATVHARLEERGLSERFRLPGYLDAAHLLAHCALLVHPSHSEGFGLAVLEALALGRPVVATRCGGPEEVVEEGRTGLLVPPGQPEALAAAIAAVLSGEVRLDPDLGRARARSFGLQSASAAFGGALGRAHERHAISRPGPSRQTRAGRILAALWTRTAGLGSPGTTPGGRT